MKRLFVAVLLVATCSLTLAEAKSKKDREQKHKDEIERTLLRMTDEWTQVDVTHDKSVLERFMADDFVSTSRSGRVRNRQELFAAWKDEGVKSATSSDVKVHVYTDNVAVVTGMDTTVGNKDGVEWVHQDRFTTTWVKRKGTWQCVAAQWNRIK
ncbi:MAG: nuclear transport factor 2 family protein [Pyrinomonadaceae bacterium]